MISNKTLLGFDIGGTNLKAGIVKEGKIIKKISFPTPLASAEALFGEVNRIIGLLSNECGPIEAVGVGIPGTISPNGIIGHSPNLPIDGFKALEFLKSHHSCPVAVDNDANMAAVGEKIYGWAQDYDNFVLLTLGTGVGSGIFIGGKLFHGSQGLASEVGHMIIAEDGPQCKCGNQGCLEKLASGTALIELGTEFIKSHPDSRLSEFCADDIISGARIFEAAEDGIQEAQSILLEIGKHLGTAIQNLANILNPELVIIGGAVSGAGKWLLPSIKEVLSVSSFKSVRSIKLKISFLKNQAAILGAAAYPLL